MLPQQLAFILSTSHTPHTARRKMKIHGMVATTLGLALIPVGSVALSANANPACPESTVITTAIEESSATANRPCGGPYKVGEDAVWSSCNNDSEQICVRQYWPYRNYQVWAPPGVRPAQCPRQSFTETTAAIPPRSRLTTRPRSKLAAAIAGSNRRWPRWPPPSNA